MKSVMQKLYEFAPSIKLGRSVFNRSHSHKTTFDAGRLIPFFWDEVLPGDTFKLSTTVLIRMNTPIVPIMDNLHVDTEYFYVPLRFIWDNYDRFFGTRRPDPDSSIDYTTPKITIDGSTNAVTQGHVLDYLGIPPGVVPNSLPNCFPTRAYTKVFNDWYRSDALQSMYTLNTDDGPDAASAYTSPYWRNKKHDYFTSCLPEPQRGDAVTLPLGTSAPVIGDGNTMTFESVGSNEYGIYENTSTPGVLALDSSLAGTSLGTSIGAGSSPTSDLGLGLARTSGNSGIIADLDSATAATISSIRLAFQIQKWQEKIARGGSRYKEILMTHFGVDDGDARLGRSEYLSGSTHYMNINPVQQTSSTDATTPQGNLAAYGMYAGNAGGFYKSFTEHGIVIGMISVRADLNYQQGIERAWFRDDRYDYYWPSFAHISEQPVYNREIFVQGAAADDEVFGYQEPYHDYRMKMNRISGQLRSDFSETLHYWHLAQDFSSLPTLNTTFLRDETHTILQRVVAVTENGEEDYPDFTMDAYFDYRCERPMPTRGIPGYVDHM